jgi:hypothetical protein
LVAGILERRAHPEQGYRASLGLMRLSRDYTPVRLEAAAARALALRAFSYRSVQNILVHGLEYAPLPEETSTVVPLFHEHLRGPEYFVKEVR